VALLLAPPWHFLEPDWVAAFAAVAAVGAALAPRRWWIGALGGGVLVFLTIGAKLATAPIALLALLAIAVIDARRSIATGLAAAAYTGIWYVLTRRFLPWEWTWLRDQASLVTSSPIDRAPRLADFTNLMHSFSDAMIISPAIAVAPAALVALVRRKDSRRSKWTGAGLAIVALVLSMAPAYVHPPAGGLASDASVPGSGRVPDHRGRSSGSRRMRSHVAALAPARPSGRTRAGRHAGVHRRPTRGGTAQPLLVQHL